MDKEQSDELARNTKRLQFQIDILKSKISSLEDEVNAINMHSKLWKFIEKHRELLSAALVIVMYILEHMDPII